MAAINARAAERHPGAKDPLMKALADCLSERGAVYEEDTGVLLYSQGSKAELKLMDECMADLAANRPLVKR